MAASENKMPLLKHLHTKNVPHQFIWRYEDIRIDWIETLKKNTNVSLEINK